jgi:hypothetical protein
VTAFDATIVSNAPVVIRPWTIDKFFMPPRCEPIEVLHLAPALWALHPFSPSLRESGAEDAVTLVNTRCTCVRVPSRHTSSIPSVFPALVVILSSRFLMTGAYAFALGTFGKYVQLIWSIGEFLGMILEPARNTEFVCRHLYLTFGISFSPVTVRRIPLRTALPIAISRHLESS